ncbi:hypothetical protein BST36_11310 [Mycolicibacterium moriokaense]|uniref:Uncharacterized protein n=1 Tax=Mycolicibacterium moriokaense TaxID=39691 RepID=A0AAD1HEF5_9MYCO|nr:hypothetical protein [Mycolicibacterium moriokaense]MCV7038350.1 hypothetical protein [Mycolicibacterium moriokaense]ORB24320.1 hypothetical protein BST36_11310 [Mycolicibacterium moriokaense]BBX02528.1 hypothetical protein MMOR_34640 [Mycolicibacterium moriokaense]
MRWSFAQFGLLIICVFHVAPTVQILGMDYNGWHAVAGLALFGPGLIFAMRKSWSSAIDRLRSH